MKKKIKIIKNIFFILGYIWQCDKKFVFIKIFYAILVGIYPMVNILFPKIIIDAITTNKSFENIIKIIFYYAIIQIAYYIIGLGIQYYDSINSALLIKHINTDILQKILNISLSFFEDPNSYDTYHKARSEASTRAKKTFDQMLSILSTIISLLTVAYILSSFNLKIIFLIIIVITIIFIISQKSKKMTFEYHKSIVKKNRKSGYLYYMMTSKIFCKEIRIFGTGKWLLEKYTKCILKLIKEQKDYLKKSLCLNGVNGVLSYLQDAAIYGSLAYTTLKNNISIGSFTMYLMAAQALTKSLNTLISLIAGIYENSLFSENLINFLSLKSNLVSGSIPVLFSDATSTKNPLIEIRNISFHYPGQSENVFSNFSLTIYRNEKLLIVGENGVGKTTLIKLLLRLYDPETGSIICNGIDIKDLILDQYRKLFSVVFQDYNQYAFTIAENVFLRDMKDDDAILLEEALKKSGLFQKINSLKYGINTCLTREFDEKGTDFSGGEMQKLALARAYVNSSSILILDEPTSALDPRAEADMYENYMTLCTDKTGIFISHRLSCAPFMDRIILIEKGTVAEEGTHEELIKKQGKYHDMFVRQGRGYVNR